MAFMAFQKEGNGGEDMGIVQDGFRQEQYCKWFEEYCKEYEEEYCKWFGTKFAKGEDAAEEKVKKTVKARAGQLRGEEAAGQKHQLARIMRDALFRLEWNVFEKTGRRTSFPEKKVRAFVRKLREINGVPGRGGSSPASETHRPSRTLLHPHKTPQVFVQKLDLRFERHILRRAFLSPFSQSAEYHLACPQREPPRATPETSLRPCVLWPDAVDDVLRVRESESPRRRLHREVPLRTRIGRCPQGILVKRVAPPLLVLGGRPPLHTRRRPRRDGVLQRKTSMLLSVLFSVCAPSLVATLSKILSAVLAEDDDGGARPPRNLTGPIKYPNEIDGLPIVLCESDRIVVKVSFLCV